MTSIGNHQQAVLQAANLLSPKLAAGQPVHARVLGATRHGLSVLIGRETFQLDASSKLANAGTLTLQGSASPSASGQMVKIVAKDDQPLPKPVEAHLSAVARTPKSDASTIVQKSEIKVVANPVSPEGKVLGPSVTLHLQPSPFGTAPKTTGGQAATVLNNKLSAEPNSPHRAPAGPRQTSASSTPSNFQPATTAGDDRVPGAGRPEPAAKVLPGVAPTPTSPSTPSVAVDPLLAVAKSNVDDVQMRGDDLMKQQRSLPSKLPTEGESASIKSPTVSATVNPGQGAATEVKSIPQATHPAVLPPASDRSGPMTASVVGRTSTGNVLLEAAGQLMRIEQPVDLPSGMALQVTIAPGTSTWLTPAGRRAPENPVTLLNKLIGLLNDIDQAGRQAAYSDHPSATKQLPTPDKHLASRFLGLLPAESGGQSLSGATPSSSERGGVVAPQRDQIQALVRDIGSMASEFLADDWKSLTLPLGSDHNQAVALYFREHDLDPDDEGSGEKAEQERAERAVFDVSFSQLGRCQIDVLCQEQRFDLLIRSEKPFGSEDRQDVAALFVSACEIAGMKGEIGFKVGGFFEPERSSAVGHELRT